MKFNTKTRYGVRVVFELALNVNRDGGTLQKEISESQSVSVKYLDHIIPPLKKAGLIANLGGKKSGYVLAKPASEITVFDVYSAFEDDLAIIDCLLTEGECPRKGQCVMENYWGELNDSIRRNMQSMNLESMADKHKQALS